MFLFTRAHSPAGLAVLVILSSRNTAEEAGYFLIITSQLFFPTYVLAM